MQKPKPHAGMHHIALNVKNFMECVQFYTELLGMKVIWQPDENNVYLTSGTDNLALHKAIDATDSDKQQHLDHLGFFLNQPDEVGQWHNYLCGQDIEIVAAPKTHRDGTRSFYCRDPDGNIVQMIYYPL